MKKTVFLLIAALEMTLPFTAGGAEDAVSPPGLEANQAPLEILKKVLDSPDFGGEKTVRGIRLKERGEDKKETVYYNPSPWPEKIRQGFALFLRTVLILTAAAAAVFLFIYARKSVPFLQKRDKARLKILEENQKGNPGALFEQALLLYNKGKCREAWSCCIRGTLAGFSLYRGIVFSEDATEYDCLGLVKKARERIPGGEAESFACLVKSWVSYAYGGKKPHDGVFYTGLAFGRSIAQLQSLGSPVERFHE
jgi:hypothetical protein